MYVRKKKNKSGKVSVQVISKSNSKYSVIKTIGCSSDTSVIERLLADGELWIKSKTGVINIDFCNSTSHFETFLDNIESLENVGIELLLAKYLTKLDLTKSRMIYSVILY